MSFDLSWLFTGQNETDRGRQLDAQLAAIDSQKYAPGGDTYVQIQNNQGTAAADAAWQKVQSDLAAQSQDTGNFNSQVAGAFASGAKSGLSNVWDALRSPLFYIPLQWWIIAGVVLFVWSGGLGWMRGRLSSKK